ncbi:hypothetical protein C2845_PM02G32680 [Panicum miliaceum]|uniref:Uncharacterized protein n=1 Tax=Panicum miliaceum TaxID=4540 RepID=A0A3L6S7K5_PANMI|nr:hypothetical protein C2845_PM02G32680 [Panicum miliaceum]
MVEISANSTPLGKKEAALAACHGDNGKGEEGAIADDVDLSRPILVVEKFDYEKFHEWTRMRSEFIAKSMPKDIIIPDPTPKDNVQCFLRLFASNRGMHWNYSITSLTLTYMVIHNALRCTRVVLEGKAPKLHWMHANPNCMNPYGYFPLHEAADRFSIDMIKLLFRHGALANVRTVGDKVIENLLPLQVALENTCLHKYLEDNLSPIQDHQDYTYNLIHLLCLPEMKIFLDTVRLLVAETDNLVDEIWNYIKDEKVVQTAVLLLAAQGQIRGNRSSKSNISGKQNGFEDIMGRMVELYQNSHKQLLESTALKCTYLLVRIISHAGEVLDTYIQHHSEVPHAEVLEHVSSILKDSGFCPTGKGIDVRNLLHLVLEAAPMTAKYLETYMLKVMREKKASGWDPDYTRRMFFPYWKSVPRARCVVKVYPSYAPAPSSVDLETLKPWSGSLGNGPNPSLVLLGTRRPTSIHQQRRLFGTAAFRSNESSRNPNRNLLLGRIRQTTVNNQSRRFFGTAALTFLKLLKNA